MQMIPQKKTIYMQIDNNGGIMCRMWPRCTSGEVDQDAFQRKESGAGPVQLMIDASTTVRNLVYC